MTIKIIPTDHGNPTGKLADAEIHFTDAPLEGLKLRKGTEVRKVKLDEIVPLVVAEVTAERNLDANKERRP